MPDFRAPGMAADPKTFRLRALGFLAATVVASVITVTVIRLIPDDSLDITMHTSSVAGGIVPGATVVANGADVGTVSDVSADAPNTFRVKMALDPDLVGDGGLLTSTMGVKYAPKNLFGIGAVVLYPDDGPPIHDGDDFTPAPPADATLTTLLRNLSDLQNKAFSPHVSDILASANQATLGLLPIVGVAGRLAEAIADTQRVSPRQTLPQYAQLVSQLQQAGEDLLPPTEGILAWQAPRRPDFLEEMHAGFSFAATTLMDDAEALLGPEELGAAEPLVAPMVSILNRVNDTFPGARRNGIEIAELIDRIDRAMPTGPRGPMLNVDLVLDSIPGVTAALGGHAR
ncbi:MlaD family protein [Gordonia sp. CPCC 206044]|uniref:MlaD family protein n=1 Tax=Gordonia sp. CPCC 206044 TaxID=3140793 RepID=UPI003AF38676